MSTLYYIRLAYPQALFINICHGAMPFHCYISLVNRQHDVECLGAMGIPVLVIVPSVIMVPPWAIGYLRC